MRALKMFGLALILAAVVSCRTIPSDVAKAHSEATTQSTAALIIADDLLAKIIDKSAELNDEFVSTQFEAWQSHFNKIADNRDVVQRFLLSAEGDTQLAEAYAVGRRLMESMNGGMYQIDRNWRLMLAAEHSTGIANFVALFRKDIGRFRELDRKFNDWISQFRVKG